jgi:hypothetical protein
MKHIHVLELRPTQFALGTKDIDFKAKKLKNMSPKQRKRYLTDRPVQVVIGPNKIYYIIDHHHLVRAAWEAGIKKVPVEVKLNLSHMRIGEFWQALNKVRFVYPYDQFGKKQKYKLFPMDVRGMADDPYRSLAWSVREEGGFDKVFIPFAEFRWANFFRKHIDIEYVRSNFDGSVRRALKLCKSSSAANLPGFKK